MASGWWKSIWSERLRNVGIAAEPPSGGFAVSGIPQEEDPQFPLLNKADIAIWRKVTMFFCQLEGGFAGWEFPQEEDPQ
jgi:hypothetical protein